MCGSLEIPLHLSLHCPFQCAFLMLHWCNTSGLMSLTMTALGDLCANTIPGGDSDKVNVIPGITCHPLRLRPERNRPAGRRWQMLLPSVPVGRPAASVATPAGRAPPAAAAPAATQTNQNRDVRQLKNLLGDYKRIADYEIWCQISWDKLCH